MQHPDLIYIHQYTEHLPLEDQRALAKKRRLVQLLFYSLFENETPTRKSDTKVQFSSKISFRFLFDSVENESDFLMVPPIPHQFSPCSSPSKHCEWVDDRQKMEPKIEEMRMDVGLETHDELLENIEKLKEENETIQKMEIDRPKLKGILKKKVEDLAKDKETRTENGKIEETRKNGTNYIDRDILLGLAYKMHGKLLEVGYESMFDSECSKCRISFPSRELVIGNCAEKDNVPNSMPDLITLGLCVNCAIEEGIDSERMRSFFVALKASITEKWSKYVEEKLLEITGIWAENINPMKSEVGSSFNQAEVASRLENTTNAENFEYECAAVIESCHLFSLKLHDFQCTHRELLRRKDNSNSEELHTLFEIIFQKDLARETLDF